MKNYFINGPVKSDFVAKYIEKLGENKTAGGQSIFLGQVRNDLVNGVPVKYIDYSAYDEMANNAFAKIEADILQKYTDIHEIIIFHSTGIVNAGEISLFVLIATGHRTNAFTALSETVELIKANVPVWKKEVLEDESYIWKE